MLSKKESFIVAKPIWAPEYLEEMNISILFRFDIAKYAKDAKSVKIRLSCSSAYQMFEDGIFKAMGPVRAGHGYYRVDEYEVNAKTLDLIVAGYNNNSFYWIDVPPFLTAEIIADGEVVCATAADGKFAKTFSARRYAERIQKVDRYSFQRNFTEAYDMKRATDFSDENVLKMVEVEDKNYIERGIYYPAYERENAEKVISRGTATYEYNKEREKLYQDRAITQIGPKLKGFTIPELEICNAWDALMLDFARTNSEEVELTENTEISLAENGYAVFDMGKNKNGLIGLTVDLESDSKVYCLFDEILMDGNPDSVNFLRLATSSVVIWNLPKGKHTVLSYEPYVFRFLKIVVIGGASKISAVHQRRVGYYMPAKKCISENPKIRAVYDAAVETFRQNVADIYMDCASRERGGWLCDSFFTSRAEYTLTGKSEVERNFLENFLQPESFKCLPKGMLPMCYPGDHYDGVFIPNWAMWYVAELQEYYTRTGDRELVDAAKTRVYELLDYFRKFENKDGLLEKLESWIFVEWSKSNELVQDINFPTNMMYSKMKKAMAKLYGDVSLAMEAIELDKVIKEKSFNGEFFVDNYVYNEAGVAVSSGMITESCQYYAFHTGVASIDEYPKLWETLVKDFGRGRRENNKYPDVYFANAFIGNYLRLDLLMMNGLVDETLENIEDYLYYMAEKTGTLWENDTSTASCSHGFASHVVCWLDQMGLLK